MDHVKILFCTSQKIGAVAIRAVTWSSFSHVAIIDGDEVIEATWPAVRVAPLAEVIAAHSAHAIVELPCRDPQAVIAAAASQIGKPYDYTAILGLGLRRDWQEEDAWFCSELVAWAFQHAGEPLFRAECLRRVTPQHLWMLAPAPPPPDPALLAPIEGRLVRPSSF